MRIWLCASCARSWTSESKRWIWGNATGSRRLFTTNRKLDIWQPLPNGHARRWFSKTANRLKEERKAILPDEPARTRFAPSPTGHLHIGGLRTALFSYLLARRTGGQFLLRVEDTDQKRLVPGAEARILHDLRWAGLSWDEGPEVGGPYGPYRQSERTAVYQKHALDLLDREEAYRCFCTPQTTREEGRASFVTSGCYQDCSSLAKEDSRRRADVGVEVFTVRLKCPRVKQSYPDLIYGQITPLKRSTFSVNAADSDSGINATDTILIKSDGTPTYHFANVVDDHLMRITHVIRGTEWMASTPLHYDLYRALGWQPPLFAHVSLLVDEQQAKLSKRNMTMALDVHGMRVENGILPEALCNFLALQGWSNPRDNDVLTMDELIASFDLKFTRGNTMVRSEKLHYLQKQHVVKRCDAARSLGESHSIDHLVTRIVAAVRSELPHAETSCGDGIQLYERCKQILLADSRGYSNALEFVRRNSYFFQFDPRQLRPIAEFYDKAGQVPGGNIVQAVERIMQEDWCNKIMEQAAFPESQRLGNAIEAATGVEQSSLKIHALIEHEASREARVQSRDMPVTSHEAHAETHAQSSITTKEASEEAASAMLKLQKSWSASIKRYLRERLAYGTPGPSIGVVMAMLGYEECCRRLDVSPFGNSDD